MSRTTMDFGIDLGTTNSCIACVTGTSAEVIRNNEGFEYTPSAVWIDRNGRLYVGRRAYEQFENDEENAALEFKLQMGKAVERTFQRSARRLKPEELSAEVLKSLLGDVRQRRGEDVQAAVITVPADFDLPQCDATRQAAKLAGLLDSPLLPEPVAAALAHGFQRVKENVYWLVYDLGGGTFDTAVIQLRDGLFRLVNHGGDRCLGGKLIDWAIVDRIFVPAAVRQQPLSDFRRGNPRWRAAFAKLKLAAEQAKIRLSRAEAAEVTMEYLCKDDRGEPVQFDCEVRRSDLERLMEPIVLRSLNIARKVLAEKQLSSGDVEKVVLVGGPTLTPYLRERLADPRDGLGIALEFGVDPLTLVAQGAALFAATQRMPAAAPAAPVGGQFTLELECPLVGADPEPLVGGKVHAVEGVDLAGFTIEFRDAEMRPPWRSGQIRLGPAGYFETTLLAEAGRLNTFLIELRDPKGRQCPTEPDRLTYTLGAALTDPPLIHSLGIALANNEMQVIIPKGTSLPARKRVVHQTATVVRKGASGDCIRIPVVEGENIRRADRNRLIGVLEVHAEDLRRDVPALSEIEITIEIDSSRLLQTWAFIPLLDEEFGNVLKFQQQSPEQAAVQAEFAVEIRRLDRARGKAEELQDERAVRVLKRIDNEEIVQDLQIALEAAANDPDAAEKAQNRLLDLKTAVDELEYALEWPALLADVRSQLDQLAELADRKGTSRDKQQAEVHAREVQRAIETENADALWLQVREIRHSLAELLWRDPRYLRGLLGLLETLRGSMRDPGLADRLLEIGNQAAGENDLSALRSALQQLIGLLPPEKRGHLPGYGGTIMP